MIIYEILNLFHDNNTIELQQKYIYIYIYINVKIKNMQKICFNEIFKVVTLINKSVFRMQHTKLN